MWTFERAPGIVKHDGQVEGTGYSGYGDGKNNPAMESVHDVGPIPRGDYTIGEPQWHPDLGRAAMALTPKPGTDTLGRSGFYWHGDSLEHPGEASHGCLITGYALRLDAWSSGDHELRVV